MNEVELQQYLKKRFPKENGRCEWKEYKTLKHAVTGKKGEDIVSYTSAIANMEGGHLVVGVEDTTLRIVGIEDFHRYDHPDALCAHIATFCANLNSERLSIETFVADDTRKTVWVVIIPKHQPRLPVYAHGKAWQRLNDMLVDLRQERLSAILAEPIGDVDWSAQTIDAATISDLDPRAIEVARTKFKEKHVRALWFSEIDRWGTATFLDKAKLTADGRMTRACLLLLGERNAAAHYLSPHPAQITWKLETEEKFYEHFWPPFILSTTALRQRIRDIPQKLFPKSQLLPVEVDKYETKSILEALHNCIAHQNYERPERILVTELVDRLVFENAGPFFEGAAEDYYNGARTPRRYRN